MARRRKFSDEYKREAVQLATQPGVTKSQVAGELGINANLLSRWCCPQHIVAIHRVVAVPFVMTAVLDPSGALDGLF